MKGATNFRNQASSGKQSFLPPKCPFPSVSPSYGDYGSIGSKLIPKPSDGHRHHHRTSSESFLIEDQPSWLDDLLNEPEIPVKRVAHRRSSSDSFAYLDANSMYSRVGDLAQEEYRHKAVRSAPQWGRPEFDQLTNGHWANYYREAKTSARAQVGGWESGMNMVNYQSGVPLSKDKGMNIRSSTALREPDVTTNVEKQEQESNQDFKGISEKREDSLVKQSQTETDTKRVKQQFAQRSRVRKLQYIAELERNVQALQAEGMEVSAELEFVDQQNLILNMENQTLKQRLDSLAQEHLIKKLQQEMLEREIARLRLLFQQQQQQQQSPQPASAHNRSKSRDLESQFTNLSLKHKDANSGREPVTGPLRT
ncbi:uncharacterized protein At4g06598-like [Asparagus officinalis]|uniref:uncharacterized protein At4g06598-like n=1 Tax=Asparagus officinalis TaxID=4686 RepID=UPI00098E5ECA|nr:uncharacterized protein At4g06598-like [Asparagus officinalis]XP_020253070.1 uncharacterized protein At4g06598-like [Asparagus officinalis]